MGPLIRQYHSTNSRACGQQRWCSYTVIEDATFRLLLTVTLTALQLSSSNSSKSTGASLTDGIARLTSSLQPHPMPSFTHSPQQKFACLSSEQMIMSTPSQSC